MKTTTTPIVPAAYAGVGAVNQSSGSIRVHRCDRCLREVGWAKSSKTGKSYLVSILSGRNDQRYYIGANLHACRTQAEVEIEDAQKKIDALSAEIARFARDLDRETDPKEREILAGYVSRMMAQRGQAKTDLEEWIRKMEKQEAEIAERIAERDAARQIAAASSHIGEVGEKIEFAGTISDKRQIEGDFGPQNLVTFVTEEGNVVKTYTTAKWSNEPIIGTRVQISGTVKRHSDRNGSAETIISRPKVLASA